ncbi:MAM domain-containing protein 2 isoform X5 [Mesoplodon densirostris]|uniref:MAM domain-containing protein 2 isoform X5 n=2 Tax=Mesoplodon densirostris TaxID=48708 RepID=UPI0028DB7676|nr:MAM domain-containing protein 2 isoform X5 [Mesoplodon densirostris]
MWAWSMAPPLPTLLPPGAACPSGLAARTPVQSSSPTMLFRGVLLAVQAALQLAGALDLPAGSCTFEESTCGFDSVFEFLPWILNEEGHYIYVDTSFAKQGEKAVLLSSDLQAEEWSCLRLVYQITTSSVSPSEPSQLNLYVRFDDESFDRLLWSAKEPSDSWLIASLDLQNSSKKFKILIEGVLGHGNTASIALFEIKMTTGYCIECDFEENHLCGFVNLWNPNVNWFVGGGNMRNSHSILPQDHTFRSELGHYMYVDSVYVKHYQEVAQLISPVTMAPMSGCLFFYYQLQQGNDNIFSVYTRDAAGLYEEIWQMGNPGNTDWNLAEVEFSAPYPMEVIFEVAFNGPRGGYVALDDISFSPVPCHNQTERPFSAVEASCNFEKDLCNFYQDKEGPGWTRVKVRPNMYRAGDHTSGLGYFLMANTKFTSQPGYIGRLYGPSLPGNLQYCLRFYYAIYGFLKMSDTLAVYIFEENHMVQDKIWSVLESPRGVWMQAEITFKKPMPTKVVFMSLCKSFWDCGLVALDDITIELGSCWSPEKLPTPPGECTFEQDECAFTQERRNRSSWHRRRGETPTSYTGPKGDHTTGVGYYMYIEASHMVYGQKAQLLSRPLRGVTGKHCLTFFYHMYGAGTGLLNVYLKKEGDSEESLLWRRRGEQSISWLRVLIEYTCERRHQIIFEAIRGVSIRSDIAIDDVKFQAGSCAEMEDITQQSSGYSEDLNEIEY